MSQVPLSSYLAVVLDGGIPGPDQLVRQTLISLFPTRATGSRTLALGVTSLVLSQPVSAPGVFTLWRGGVIQAPSGYTVNPAGSATITIPAVDDPAGELFEWIHNGVDPLTIAAAQAALGV